jgi:phenylalanyl-tRNA synthetase alpha chain
MGGPENIEQIKSALNDTKTKAIGEITSAKSPEELKNIKAKYVGRNDGQITLFLRGLKNLAQELRPIAGELANRIKNEIESATEEKLQELKKIEEQRLLDAQWLDHTLPGRKIAPGRIHPVIQIITEIVEIFKMMGFEVREGPEIETDYYNFEGLNIPKHHPARDMHDTFYLPNNMLLRTHTSPVQVRVMEKAKPPLAVVVPGKVYRRDSDISHSPMFHQVEGFMVDRGVSFANLKGILTEFLKAFFGRTVRSRFRPSYFPFTEPSAEVDIECILCSGRGCRVCKNTGWLEVLGCGMIHQQVLKNVRYEPRRFSGFAFGLGVERFTMLRYRIDDIRLFFQNDVRFLEQF